MERVERATTRAGRRPGSVRVLAVCKKQPIERIREAWEAGQRAFGENHVQELERKLPMLALQGAEWHLIGHLQSNKARRAAELFQVVETVDSVRLAGRLNEAAAAGRLPVFIEVKLSAEETKSGCSEQDLPALVEAVKRLPELELRGLMTVPPFTEDPDAARPYFSRLRDLNESLGLPELSMGMSHDFETAIAEGATLVRIGTAIFGERNYGPA
jgi:pyridoxal phosphate enzyme (YggS family)